MQKALNDAFSLEYDEIYITDSYEWEANASILYQEESITMSIFPDENQLFLYGYGTNNKKYDYIVNVPSLLSDRIDEVKQIIEQNKPAGRIYQIKIYAYE